MVWRMVVVVLTAGGCISVATALVASHSRGFFDREASAAANSATELTVSGTREGMSFPSGIGALGRIEPQSEVLRIHAPSVMEPPRIQTLLVEEGEWVTAGQTLAVLDNRHRCEAAVAEARAQGVLAERSLEKVLAGAKAGEIRSQAEQVSVCQSQLRFSERQLERSVSLLASNAISHEEHDQQRSMSEVRRHELERAQALLISLQEIRTVDVRHAEAEVARTAAVIERELAELETSEIRSPIDGTILKIHARPGERIGDGGFLDLGDTLRMDVVAEVHEADAPRLRLHQSAQARLVASDIRLKGEVVRIGRLIGRKDVLSSDPVDDTDARVIEVRIRLDEDSSRRVEALSYAKAEVMIRCSEHTSVVNGTSAERALP